MSTFNQVDGRFSQPNTANYSAFNNRTAEGNTMSESSNPSNLQYTPATTVEDLNDSGFFDNDLTNTLQAQYKDWTLFEDELVDVDTSLFFADVDASIKAHNGSAYERTESENSTIIESGASNHPQGPNRMNSLPYDPVHEAVQEMIQQSVWEEAQQVLKQENFGIAGEVKGISKLQIQSHHGAQDPEPSVFAPLDTWASTRHRHEYIAYLLEQPPYPVRDFR